MEFYVKKYPLFEHSESKESLYQLIGIPVNTHALWISQAVSNMPNDYPFILFSRRAISRTAGHRMIKYITAAMTIGEVL